MAPKFKGSSEDWLDDESGSGSQKPKPRKNSKKAVALPPEQANGTVAEVFPKQCRVNLDDGGELLCSYKREGVIGALSAPGAGERERAPVAVGDRVRVETLAESGSGRVTGLCIRENSLFRVAPGREQEKVVHVLVSNIDLLVIVASVREPDFSPGLVDRFLVAAGTQGIDPLVCVNKSDLAHHQDQGGENASEAPWSLYEKLGIPVLEVSSRSGSGLSRLRQEIDGKQVAFCGHSGVGKTSLLAALMNEQAGRVGDVNEFTGKGRHTTTGAILLGGPGESRWIDTPGVRAFGLIGLKRDQLKNQFPEFSGAECAVAGCMHEEEPGCSVRGYARYESYRRILDSLE